MSGYPQQPPNNVGPQWNGANYGNANLGTYNDHSQQTPYYQNNSGNQGFQNNGPVSGGNFDQKIIHGSNTEGNKFTSYNYGGRNMSGQVTGGTFVQGDYRNDSRDTHNTYNNQNNQGRMVGGPIHGGNVNFGDTHNNSQNFHNTGHLNYVSGTMSVGGNFNQISGASGGGSSESNESKDLHKAFEEFASKYLSDGAIHKPPQNPYPMGKKGKMLIINNEKWPRKLRSKNGQPINEKGEFNRQGTNKDRDALIELSKYIEFGEAEVRQDRTVQQMKDDLEEFATGEDWKSFDAAIVCILSHGGENSCIYGTDQNLDEKLDMAELLQTFSEQPDLQGKPKIFIIQACRGGQYDNKAASDGGNAGNSDKMDFASAEDIFRSASSFFADALPSQQSVADSKYKSHAADILVLWATGWGFLAWRESSGSFFIQELTNTIKDEKNKGKHLIEMMEEVITAVKNRFSGGTSKAGQCPQFLSSLDRKLCLR